MIYCVDAKIYPKEGQFIEELKYKDENDFEWRICRIKNGFMVRYFGDEYFKDNTFSFELSNGKIIRINNTNCIFFNDTNFDTFCEVRTILKNGFTDDIWEVFEDLLRTRFEHDEGFLESEIVL
jgi:hypothetical protein